MDYKTKRYKQGLEGKKPSSIWLDKEGHRAQQAGYRDHLKNQDLADRIRQRQENDSGDSYESAPSAPFEGWQRVFWFSIGLMLLIGDLAISAAFAEYTIIHSRNPEIDYWVSLVLSAIIVPGGILGWPGLMLIGVATDKST